MISEENTENYSSLFNILLKITDNLPPEEKDEIINHHKRMMEAVACIDSAMGTLISLNPERSEILDQKDQEAREDDFDQSDTGDEI